MGLLIHINKISWTRPKILSLGSTIAPSIEYLCNQLFITQGITSCRKKGTLSRSTTIQMSKVTETLLRKWKKPKKVYTTHLYSMGVGTTRKGSMGGGTFFKMRGIASMQFSDLQKHLAYSGVGGAFCCHVSMHPCKSPCLPTPMHVTTIIL